MSFIFLLLLKGREKKESERDRKSNTQQQNKKKWQPNKEVTVWYVETQRRKHDDEHTRRVVTSAKSESRDGLVTWSSLLNSKRWQSLPHTPHITGDINRKMTYRELLRSMFPRASAIQIQAMQKFSPSCY